MFWGLGFRVEGLGFRGLGFRGLGFRVWLTCPQILDSTPQLIRVDRDIQYKMSEGTWGLGLRV